MNSNLVSKAVRYALVAGAATAMAAPAVFAQDATQSSNNQNQNANTAQLGKIEVTGTRIKRTDVETAQPVTIVTAAQIKATGLVSIGDVLQSLSSAGSALNTQFNNGGNGRTQIDLRNLGSNRVLVLVNGKRWITGLGGPGEQGVDLNTIPVSIIDHIEILQDGASAIYGSDAIAGVINIITVKNYNGAEANAYLGIYDGKNDGGGWDGKQQEYDFTIGSSGDRSSVVMNVSYVNESPIWAGNRSISKEPLVGTGPGSNGGTATPYYAGSAATPAGLVLAALPGGCPVPLTPSGSCAMTLKSFPVNGKPAISDYKTYTPADSFNFAPLNYLVTPSERTSLFVQGRYDLADNLTFSTMALYNKRNSQQVLAPSPLYLGAAGSSQANKANIGIAANNPYNPFGTDLVPDFGSASGAAWCAEFGSPTCSPATSGLLVLLGRRPLEGGNRVFNQNVETYQINSGLSGYFNMLGGEWDWDVGYNYADNYETDVTSGLFNTERIANALSSGCVTGAIVGCVPLDMFGGNGTITPAMLQYVQYEAHDVTDVTMRDYTANITGEIGDWFGAGQVGTALGYEYLSNDGLFHPDALTSGGNTSGNVTQPTNGKEVTNAEYIEFNVPILADLPMAKSLSLDIANRWSQFRWKGGIPGTSASTITNYQHANTARAALKWQTSNDLLLRGSWSQGFRLPAISEFYLGNSDSFPAVLDPCVPKNGIAAPFCLANAGPGPYTQPNKQIRGTIGGNPALTPERSISKSAGFVYNPDWLPGFDISADYYHIQLLNAVSRIGFQNIYNGCYVQNNQTDCKLITRAGAGVSNQIVNALNINTNIGGIRTAGWDINTHYKFPSTGVGDFKLGLNWTFVKDFTQTVPTSTNATGVTNISQLGIETGSGGVPRQKANLSLNWNYGDWSALWNVEYIHSMVAPCAGGSTAPGFALGSVPIAWCSQTQGTIATNKKGQKIYVGAFQHIGATFYHDVQATYHVDSWNTDFTFGIRNLFDKEPPVVLNAFANSMDPTYYRAPGRQLYLRVGVKF